MSVDPELWRKFTYIREATETAEDVYYRAEAEMIKAQGRLDAAVQWAHECNDHLRLVADAVDAALAGKVCLVKQHAITEWMT